MNLENMSIEQLQLLQDQINRELKMRRVRDKKAVLSKIKAMAAASGYSLEELVGSQAGVETVKPTRAVAPKYRHPQNSELTWTGRGKQPKWVAEHMAGGKKLSDLLI